MCISLVVGEAVFVKIRPTQSNYLLIKHKAPVFVIARHAQSVT